MNLTKKLLLLALLVPASALATITPTDRGTGGNNGSEAATTVTPGSNMAAGSTGILVFAADNANAGPGNFPALITDSVGNKWMSYAHQSPTSANGNVEIGVYVGYLTTAFTTSNSLTFTYSAANVVAKAWTLTEAAPTSGNVVIATSSAAANTTASGTPTITSSNVFTTGDLIIGGGGAESGDTYVDDADTTNGTWSARQSTGFGSGATGMSVMSQSKVLTTGNGAQTFNPTLTSADSSLAWVSLTEGPAKMRGASAGNASTASLTATLTIPIAAGSTCAWAIAGDNNGTSGTASNYPGTVTDSNGSTWTLRQNGIYSPTTAGTGVELAVYTIASNPTLLAAGGTITATFGTANVVAKGSVIFEFSDATAYSTGAAGTGATTGTPSVTSGSITNGDYIIGVAGVESTNTWTADSDTSNGSWSTAAMTSGGTGAAGMSGVFQYKKVTAAGAQTFNPTCTSADTMIQWTELTAPAANVQLKIPTIPSIGGSIPH